jgi:hypothetical protein
LIAQGAGRYPSVESTLVLKKCLRVQPK